MDGQGQSEPGGAVVRKGRGFTIFLVVLCAGLATEVLLLVGKTKKLEEQLVHTKKEAPTVRPGDAFEPFTVIDKFDASTLIEFAEDQPETLLLVFSLECAACEEVFPLWTEVIPAESTNVLRIIPLHLGPHDSLSEVESSVLPVPAFSVSPSDLDPFRKITRIPATLLLSSAGPHRRPSRRSP